MIKLDYTFKQMSEFASRFVPSDQFNISYDDTDQNNVRLRFSFYANGYNHYYDTFFDNTNLPNQPGWFRSMTYSRKKLEGK